MFHQICVHLYLQQASKKKKKKKKKKKRGVPLADWALAGWLAGWLVGWLAGWLGAMCMDLASIVVQMLALMCGRCLCSNLYGQVH